MKIENVSCREVMNHICDSLGEELDSPKCRAIKEHLNMCDNCQKYFSSVDKTIKFYKLYNVEINPETHQRLLNKLGLSDEA